MSHLWQPRHSAPGPHHPVSEQGPRQEQLRRTRRPTSSSVSTRSPPSPAAPAGGGSTRRRGIHQITAAMRKRLLQSARLLEESLG
eukprot:scaffold7897_cov248-Pinguiococcus_pyrenoidosus.AAC.1